MALKGAVSAAKDLVKTVAQAVSIWRQRFCGVCRRKRGAAVRPFGRRGEERLKFARLWLSFMAC